MRLSVISVLVGALLSATVPGAVWGQDTSSVPSPQPRAYRINPGDELEVYVWGEERLQRTNKVPSEVEKEVSAGLRGQYRDTVPQVTVSVRSAVGLQISIAGKVRSPGAFTPGRYVNVLEALALAGGPADFADVANVRILRKSGAGLVVIPVRLTDVLKGNPSSRDLAGLPQLESGDT